MPVEESRLAAIIQLDVAAHLHPRDPDEDGERAILRDHLSELIEPRVVEHEGRIVMTRGNGFLLEFQDAVDAARCALSIQTGMAARNNGLSEAERMDFRIGLHLGDVVGIGDDIRGDGVTVAARVAGLADLGGICLSGAARDKVVDRITAPTEELGEIEIANMARPIQVFKIPMNAPAPPKGLARLSRFHRRGLAAVVAAVVIYYSYEIWFP